MTFTSLIGKAKLRRPHWWPLSMTSADLDDLSLAESLLPFALHFAQDPFGAFPRPFSRESRRCEQMIDLPAASLQGLTFRPS